MSFWFDETAANSIEVVAEGVKPRCFEWKDECRLHKKHHEKRQDTMLLCIDETFIFFLRNARENFTPCCFAWIVWGEGVAACVGVSLACDIREQASERGCEQICERACEHLMSARARALVSTLAIAAVRVSVNTSVKRLVSAAASTLMSAPVNACLRAPVSTLGRVLQRTPVTASLSVQVSTVLSAPASVPVSALVKAPANISVERCKNTSYTVSLRSYDTDMITERNTEIVSHHIAVEQWNGRI